jgi:hypothetical protein
MVVVFTTLIFGGLMSGIARLIDVKSNRNSNEKANLMNADVANKCSLIIKGEIND